MTNNFNAQISDVFCSKLTCHRQEVCFHPELLRSFALPHCVLKKFLRIFQIFYQITKNKIILILLFWLSSRKQSAPPTYLGKDTHQCLIFLLHSLPMGHLFNEVRYYDDYFYFWYCSSEKLKEATKHNNRLNFLARAYVFFLPVQY